MIQIWSKRMFSFMLSALLAVAIFAVPQQAQAGGDSLIGVSVTDDNADRLVGYFDLRERETFFQVTNTSGSAISVHVQIFDATGNCIEFDYFDNFTPRDTHVYDVRNLDRNDGVALAAPDLTGGHGIIAVSVSTVNGVPVDDIAIEDDNVLTGNFRIIDDAGYEYRTNMGGAVLVSTADEPFEAEYEINFNNADGSTFADLVVIAYEADPNDDTIFPTLAVVQPTLYDENENPVSCSPTIVGCFSSLDELFFFEGFGFGSNVLNVGINQAVTNSRGAESICLGTDTVGHLELDFAPDFFDNGSYDLWGAIFIGLNDGNSTGSMDHAIAD